MSIVSDLVAGGIKGIFDSLTGVIHSLKLDPTTEATLLAQVETEKQKSLVALAGIDAQVIASVNATMQAETKSEHWLQYSWRPLGAYLFYALLVHNYVTGPYVTHYLGVVQVPIPMEVWYVFLALLGVSAYTRGINQIEQTKNDGKP